MIHEKLNFEESDVIHEEDDYITPERQPTEKKNLAAGKFSILPDTTAKKSCFQTY